MKPLAIVIFAGLVWALAGCSQGNGLAPADWGPQSRPTAIGGPHQAMPGRQPSAYHANANEEHKAATGSPRDHSGQPWQFQDTDEAKCSGEWYGIIGPPFNNMK